MIRILVLPLPFFLVLSCVSFEFRKVSKTRFGFSAYTADLGQIAHNSPCSDNENHFSTPQYQTQSRPKPSWLKPGSRSIHPVLHSLSLSISNQAINLDFTSQFLLIETLFGLTH